MAKFTVEITVTANSDGKGGAYMEAVVDGYTYGQYYPQGTSLMEAKARFINR